MCGWNPMQCVWGFSFFMFRVIYPHIVVMESYFSCFKKTHPQIIGIQVQSNNTQHMWICVHVFMCVVLLVSIVLGVNLVMDNMIDWFWKSAFGTTFELVDWGGHVKLLRKVWFKRNSLLWLTISTIYPFMVQIHKLFH